MQLAFSLLLYQLSYLAPGESALFKR